ncbi:hypothetical protein ACFUTV_43580 [Streptomyces sp. NPDC057298]|uniref:hypothetical protein n=1 Tax=Streptomyces sp. NPDC057298 TaxID=3346091 RepID=UPI003638C8AA
MRRQLLHAAVLTPGGQWLVQHSVEFPVQLLAGPTTMVDLSAEMQHHIRTTRNRTR